MSSGRAVVTGKYLIVPGNSTAYGRARSAAWRRRPARDAGPDRRLEGTPMPTDPVPAAARAADRFPAPPTDRAIAGGRP